MSSWPMFSWKGSSMDYFIQIVLGGVLLVIGIRMALGAILPKWRTTWKRGVPMSVASHLILATFFTVGGINCIVKLPARLVVPYMFLPLVVALGVSRLIEVLKDRKGEGQ